VIPLVKGRGNPLSTFLTLAQMRMARVPFGRVQRFVMKTIQYEEQNIALAGFLESFRRQHGLAPLDLNNLPPAAAEALQQWLLQSPSIRYAENVVVQSGHRIKSVRIAPGDGRTRIGAATYARADGEHIAQLMDKYGVWDGTKVPGDYNLVIEVEPCPACVAPSR
jgi:hypothetical protein